LGVPEYIKSKANGLGLIKHEKTFEITELGTERISVFLPESFRIDKDYWNQFLPDYSVNAGALSEKEREYKYVGNEIVHISYDTDEADSHTDLRELSGCPHVVCRHCQQIKPKKTQFENGVYRLIKDGDYFEFHTNANLIQATMWVKLGQGQIYSYEGNNEFMKSEIIPQDKLASVSTYGRFAPRSVKFYSRVGTSAEKKISYLWCHISRYNITNWPL